MSTRATIHFEYESGETAAIVYRHNDGYPDGLGKDLAAFVDVVKAQTKDRRFNDPSYLAAKWVVWDADQHAYTYETPDYTPKKTPMLAFLGVGIVLSDPGDIEYRYHVRCDGLPTITHESV